MRYLYLIGLLLFLVFQSNYCQTSVTDYDGNIYEVIQIGKQYWLKENLKTFHYSNGDSIPLVSRYAEWSNLSIGACCYPNNNINNFNDYGLLYNFYTVIDSRNVCPVGWRVPTDSDWLEIEKYLGGFLVAGGKMKESDFMHWNSPNTGATNESDFSALPAGFRAGHGGFYPIGISGVWWSSTVAKEGNAWARDIANTSAYLYTSSIGSDSKNPGISIRCVKNVSTAFQNNYYSSNIKIFPNPASNYIQIKMGDIFQNDIKIDILDINGRKIAEYSMDSDNYKIDVSNLYKGVYILNIYTINFKERTLFIKK